MICERKETFSLCLAPTLTLPVWAHTHTAHTRVCTPARTPPQLPPLTRAAGWLEHWKPPLPSFCFCFLCNVGGWHYFLLKSFLTRNLENQRVESWKGRGTRDRSPHFTVWEAEALPTRDGTHGPAGHGNHGRIGIETGFWTPSARPHLSLCGLGLILLFLRSRQAFSCRSEDPPPEALGQVAAAAGVLLFLLEQWVWGGGWRSR